MTQSNISVDIAVKRKPGRPKKIVEAVLSYGQQVAVDNALFNQSPMNIKTFDRQHYQQVLTDLFVAGHLSGEALKWILQRLTN